MSPPNNLPQQFTSFIGRKREIVEIRRLLGTTRLLTLTGAGGCGKTRLAVQVAARLLREYPDGVWFVDLASLAATPASHALVPQAVASVFGVPEQSGRSLTESLVDYLHPHKLLLVVDNCEHLCAACCSLADTLLWACPHLRILATGRQALGLAGEIAWRVPSLSLPDPNQRVSFEQSRDCEAVQLFTARALFRRPGFKVTGENVSAVTRVCSRLDGIPLAIELAAARLNVLTAEEILERLDEPFRLLAAGSQAALPRHQTLRAAIDWSYGLLSEAEQALLRSLAVFAGGFTLEAVEAIAGGEIDEYETLDLLSQLVDKSLVIVEERGGKSRYRLLETIRQYGGEQLRAEGELSALRDRHLDWYLDLVERNDQAGRPGWPGQLLAERDNLRAALEWATSEETHAEEALRLALALEGFWVSLSESRNWLEQAATLPSGASALRASAFTEAGTIAWRQGDYRRAEELHEHALALYRELGNRWGIAKALNNLAAQASERGERARAERLYEESLACGREIGDRDHVAAVLVNLGVLAGYHEDYALAQARFEQSLVIYQEIDVPYGIMRALANLGEMAQCQDHYERARTLYEESLLRVQPLENHYEHALIQHKLGLVAQHEGDYALAASHLLESLAAFQAGGLKREMAMSLAGLGGVAVARGDARRAARLFGAAEAMLTTIGGHLEPADLVDYRRNLAAARPQLDAETWAAAWAAGQAMTLDETLAFARQAAPDTGQEVGRGKDARPPAPPYPNDLTPREVDVLRLVAAGLTNKEIAERLYVSPHTVEAHVHSILNKLNVTNRSAATSFATKHHLV